MLVSHTDLSEGVHSDIIVRVVGESTNQSNDMTVELLLEDDGSHQFTGFVSEDTAVSAVDWQVGDWYVFEDVLGVVDDGEMGIKLGEQTTVTRHGQEVDDWIKPHWNNQTLSGSGGHVSAASGNMQAMSLSSSASQASAAPTESIGFATGGGKDITNFRDNIKNGFLPQVDSVTYEGLFYDYYFDTGNRNDSGNGLFYPTFTTARDVHPLTEEKEEYITVGLNSNLTTDQFERKTLNLCVVLDISGSMNSDFDEYYYDEKGVRREVDADLVDSETKMDAAIESLCALTEQLKEDDHLGVVLFNNQSHVAKPLRDVSTTDMDAIREHIREIRSDGGTNMEGGYNEAYDMLKEYSGASQEKFENRIVFMTDAMPNTNQTERSPLVNLMDDAAQNNVHTTFIGMGIDSNADLISSLSEVRGANHYFVHSSDEFRERLGDEFDYMVTPLVFDLELSIEADGYEIKTVYGSPSADEESGSIMQVNTLFPSPTDDGETRGGVVLVKTTKTSASGELTLRTSWVERDGTEGSDTAIVEMDKSESYFDNSGIRKAILLSRYAELLRSWLQNTSVDDSIENAEGPIDDWEEHMYLNGRENSSRSEWEQSSTPLIVSPEYAEQFNTFVSYLEEEIDALDDDTLKQEQEVLNLLLKN